VKREAKNGVDACQVTESQGRKRQFIRRYNEFKSWGRPGVLLDQVSKRKEDVHILKAWSSVLELRVSIKKEPKEPERNVQRRVKRGEASESRNSSGSQGSVKTTWEGNQAKCGKRTCDWKKGDKRGVLYALFLMDILPWDPNKIVKKGGKRGFCGILLSPQAKGRKKQQRKLPEPLSGTRAKGPF